jgi:hypothetical protein
LPPVAWRKEHDAHVTNERLPLRRHSDLFEDALAKNAHDPLVNVADLDLDVLLFVALDHHAHGAFEVVAGFEKPPVPRPCLLGHARGDLVGVHVCFVGREDDERPWRVQNVGVVGRAARRAVFGLSHLCLVWLARAIEWR